MPASPREYMSPSRKPMTLSGKTLSGLNDTQATGKKPTHKPQVLRRPRSATSQRATANEKRQQNIVGNTSGRFAEGGFVKTTSFEFKKGVLTTSPPGNQLRTSPPQLMTKGPTHLFHVRSDLDNLHTLIQTQKQRADQMKLETERQAVTINDQSIEFIPQNSMTINEHVNNCMETSPGAHQKQKLKRPQSAPHKRQQQQTQHTIVRRLSLRPPSGGKTRSSNLSLNVSRKEFRGRSEQFAQEDSDYEVNVVRPALAQLRNLLFSGENVGPILAYLSGTQPLPNNVVHVCPTTRAYKISEIFKARIKEMALNAEDNGCVQK
jgi:hypothetical protein